jgi:outer membrane receptor protein involved in Fe transport
VRQHSYLDLNARLTYLPSSEKWEAFVSASNLGNIAVIGSSVAAPANGSQIVSYHPPRMVYAGARFHFD